MKKKIFRLTLVAMAFSAMGAYGQNIQLNHIALYVTNLKVSTQFYQGVLGLDTIANPFNDGKHTWFTVGPKSHLHLIEGAKEKINQDKNSHLCFSVRSVEKFVYALSEYHIPYESWIGEEMKATHRVDGVQQIYFKDPDGYWIEINDARE